MAKLRIATLDDLDILVQHRRAMFEALEEGTPDVLDAHDAAYRRWARTRLKNGTLAGFVVEARGAPVASGCAWLQPIQPGPGRLELVQPYLMSMWTHPAFRGKGIARRIVRAAMKWARERGHARMSLHAAPMGRGVYAALGFERTWEMRALLTPRAPRRSPRAGPARSPARSRNA